MYVCLVHRRIDYYKTMAFELMSFYNLNIAEERFSDTDTFQCLEKVNERRNTLKKRVKMTKRCAMLFINFTHFMAVSAQVLQQGGAS